MTTIILTTIYGWLLHFWGWIAAACVAILTLLFSPTLRKYTIGVIAASILLIMTYLYGYNSNHNVEIQQHKCSEYAQLMAGEVTKVVNIFKRHGLCE